MAKSIDFSLASHGQPWGANSAEWEQTAFNEQTASSVIAQLGSAYATGKVYVLYGCELTSTAGTTSVAAGMLFLNSKFYEMTATSYPDPSGGNVSVVNLVTTYGDGVGTTFADSTVANVLIKETAICAAGTSGDFCLYSELVFCSNVYSFSLVGLSGRTFTFERNSIYEIGTPATGSVSFTLDFTNARIGAEVIVMSAISSTPTISISDGGAVSFPFGDGYSTLVGKTSVIFKFKYLGNPATHRYMIESYAY